MTDTDPTRCQQCGRQEHRPGTFDGHQFVGPDAPDSLRQRASDTARRRTCNAPGCVNKPHAAVTMRAGVSAAWIYLCLQHATEVHAAVSRVMGHDHGAHPAYDGADGRDAHAS